MAPVRAATAASDRTASALTVNAVAGVVLGAVDVVVGGAVQDQLGRQRVERPLQRGGVGEIDLAAGQRRHVVGAGPPLDGDASELAGGADDHDLHAACFIRASSKTPSQRATTTEATQLPMTFTAVRPMSRI